MVVLEEPATVRGDGVPALVLSGAMDPIVPANNAARLVRQLEAAGAVVEHSTLPAGHGLGQADLLAARDWFAARSPAA